MTRGPGSPGGLGGPAGALRRPSSKESTRGEGTAEPGPSPLPSECQLPPVGPSAGPGPGVGSCRVGPALLAPAGRLGASALAAARGARSPPNPAIPELREAAPAPCAQPRRWTPARAGGRCPGGDSVLGEGWALRARVPARGHLCPGPGLSGGCSPSLPSGVKVSGSASRFACPQTAPETAPRAPARPPRPPPPGLSRHVPSARRLGVAAPPAISSASAQGPPAQRGAGPAGGRGNGGRRCRVCRARLSAGSGLFRERLPWVTSLRGDTALPSPSGNLSIREIDNPQRRAAPRPAWLSQLGGEPTQGGATRPGGGRRPGQPPTLGLAAGSWWGRGGCKGPVWGSFLGPTFPKAEPSLGDPISKPQLA